MTSSSFNITTQTIISRCENLIYKDIDNETVMLSIENEEYYNLNKLGSSIWKYIIDPISIDTLIDKLTEQYDVSRDKCKFETIEFVKKLYELKIISLSNG